MRIAQVITLFLPDFVGGATLACARVARGLAARGHEVAVFCGRPHPDTEPYGESAWTVDGLRVTGVNAASGYAPLDPRYYRHPEVNAAFERFLARERPEVLHFHSLQALGANLLETAAAHGLPIVLTMHDWWWFCARLFLVDLEGFVCPPRVDPTRCHCARGYDFVARRRYLDPMLAYADRILAPSRFLADAAIANGVERARVEVSPNGIDLPPWAGRRRPGPVRFGYLGGPDNRLKGLPTLLAATAELDVGGWELVLHAAPQNEVRAPATVRDRVRAVPAFPPARLAAVLAELDCVVVPSLMRESYSLVAREALAAGVPVIASDSGGPGEVVRDGENGFVFATGDARDLAARMRQVVLHPELRERLRAGALCTIVPSLATQVAQLERIYEDVRRRPRPRARQSGPEAASQGALLAPPAPEREARAGGVLAPVAMARDGDQSPPRRVLFVAGMDGAPLRYRVTNLRDQLRLHGIASRAVYFTDPAVPEAIAEADLVVVYRVPMEEHVRQWLAHARRLARPLVFSCDDLIFDPAATPHAALALLPGDQRAWWLAAVERYAQTLCACDAFIGTTEPLVAAAARLGVTGFVVRNGLGTAQLAVAEQARKSVWRRSAGGADSETRRAAVAQAGGRLAGSAGACLRLAYSSGTTMHDLDFATIEPALAEVLGARPDARLRLVGYLRTGPALAPFRDRIERLPFLPWNQLFTALSDVDVNLAPLRQPDPFSDAKSEVKYLEAAVLGVPTVATRTRAFCHALRDRENGRLAGPHEWREVLLELLDDAGLRRRLGNAARDDAFLRYTPAAQAEALVGALQAIQGGAGRPPASASVPEAHGAPETGRYDLEPEDAIPGAAQLSRDTPSPFLLPGRTVGQTFCAAAAGLTRIDIALGTDSRPHSHRLIVHLAEHPGHDVPDLRRVVVDPGAYTDGAWAAAEFPPVADSAGGSFYVWIESEGASESDAVTLWTYTRGWGEEIQSGLHLDHAPAPGSLTFRTFHARPG